MKNETWENTLERIRTGKINLAEAIDHFLKKEEK